MSIVRTDIDYSRLGRHRPNNKADSAWGHCDPIRAPVVGEQPHFLPTLLPPENAAREPEGSLARPSNLQIP